MAAHQRTSGRSRPNPPPIKIHADLPKDIPGKPADNRRAMQRAILETSHSVLMPWRGPSRLSLLHSRDDAARGGAQGK